MEPLLLAFMRLARQAARHFDRESSGDGGSGAAHAIIVDIGDDNFESGADGNARTDTEVAGRGVDGDAGYGGGDRKCRRTGQFAAVDDDHAVEPAR